MPEDDVRSRLIPQFSIRWLFAVTAIGAMTFSIVGLGVRGSGWALAVSFAVASLAILILTYALMFAAVWVFSVVFGRFLTRLSRAGHSPFVPNTGSSSQAESPFARTDNEQAGEGPVAPAVEAILVETSDDPSHPGPGTAAR